MANRVFTSYDYDKALKDLLIVQAGNPDSPFEVHGWSIKEPSVVCGKHTHTAKGVAIALKIAQDEPMEYFLLKGYASKVCTKPTTATAGDKTYDWTWRNLNLLIGGAR
ncbi:hypothetical protein [Nonomuraea sp. NPDC023979]|uniref:hypothetical protein n=1 Tax=Nonomuraea sp. NPDC023979 TaxID=3154796 RepID=UPI0033FFFB72